MNTKLGLFFFALFLFPARAWGQGCVATGSSGLMFGSSEHRTYALNLTPATGQKTETSVSSVSPTPRLWELSVGYRWFRSQRHFVGATEQTHREDEGSAVVNNNHLIDLDLSRSIFGRWRVRLGLPVFIASR